MTEQQMIEEYEKYEKKHFKKEEIRRDFNEMIANGMIRAIKVQKRKLSRLESKIDSESITIGRLMKILKGNY